MGDLTKILDGNVGEVKTALEGKSNVDLLELRKQEAAGKNRSGVLTAIDAALAPAGESAGGAEDAAAGESAVGVEEAAAGESAAGAEDAAAGESAVGVEDAAAGENTAGAENAAAGDTADNGIAPAATIDTSGAPQQIVPDVDMTHPAVDADPRAHTTAVQNRIDFNDPSLDGPEAVEANLEDQASA